MARKKLLRVISR